MRLNEVLTESAIQELNEGPFGQAVGKAASGLARGVGAVAGGVAGMGSAAKQGYNAGKSAVAGTAQQATGQQSNAQAGNAAAPAQQGAAQTPQQQAEATIYKQVKDLVSKLDKKGKQRILAALNKDLGVTQSPIKVPKIAKPVTKRVRNTSAPAGTPAATPKVVRGGKLKTA